MKRFLEAGRLNSPRGLKGEIRLECWCDSMEFLAGVSRLYLDKEGTRALEVERFLPHLGTVQFKGYPDRTAVSDLTGRTVWFDRGDVTLPAGSWFNSDLIGTPVAEEGGREVGKIRDVIERNGAFLWEICDPTEQEAFLFPAVPAFLVSVTPGEQAIVRLIDGMEDWHAI